MGRLEGPVQTSVAKNFRKLGYFVVRLRATDITGIPDLLCLKEGESVFVECKAPGEYPKPKQRYIHELLRKIGFTVLVIDYKITKPNQITYELKRQKTKKPDRVKTRRVQRDTHKPNSNRARSKWFSKL